MPKIFSRQAAALELGISVGTLDRYRKNGKLPYRKLGDRILHTDCDLQTLLDACGVPATVLPTSREELENSRFTGGTRYEKNTH